MQRSNHNVSIIMHAVCHWVIKCPNESLTKLSFNKVVVDILLSIIILSYMYRS